MSAHEARHLAIDAEARRDCRELFEKLDQAILGHACPWFLASTSRRVMERPFPARKAAAVRTVIARGHISRLQLGAMARGKLRHFLGGDDAGVHQSFLA